MTTNNGVNTPLSGNTGTGSFVGSVSPTITGTATISNILIPPGGYIYSTGNVQVLKIIEQSSSAVNGFYIEPTNTGFAPVFAVTGSDTNISMQLNSQGTGGVTIQGNTSASNAPAGYVGEFVSSVIASTSSVSLTTNIIANATSINLSAGDWNVWGNLNFLCSAAAGTGMYGWVTSTSLTAPDRSLYNSWSTTGGGNFGFNIPEQRFNISGATTIYLCAEAIFSTSTTTVCGGIYARRVR
jgi:hypothetical protein